MGVYRLYTSRVASGAILASMEGGGIIRNVTTLAANPARSDLLAIAEAGLEAIQTRQIIERSVIRSGDILMVRGVNYDLAAYDHVYFVGVGKCALDAGVSLVDILGDSLTEGVLLDVRDGDALPQMQVLMGTHPYPSAQNVAHTRTLLDVVRKGGEKDLVFMVISGGASALLCQPERHTPSEESLLIQHLFKAGATIHDLNTVRKHLSLARGGQLATAAYPAEVIALIFSDVPGNDLSIIASGPTILDTSTVDDARSVFRRYYGERCGFKEDYFFETPKVATMFSRVHNELVLTNGTALDAMQERASALGYRVLVRDTGVEGEARQVGEMLAHELHAAHGGTVLLYGGETTVTVAGPGKGGRNQELSLGALPVLKDDELVLSIASDGRDNTEYAGGIADRVTRELAKQAGLSVSDYLYTNDAYTFFHTLQQGVCTGYTGANVADLIIGMKCASG